MARERPYSWQKHLDAAKAVLADYPGEFVIATDAYVAFRYLEPTVRVVFYPHLHRSSGHISLRVRAEPCKDMGRARQICAKLETDAEWGTGFYRKNTTADETRKLASEAKP